MSGALLRPEGYILRITKKEWVTQVFDLTRYYVGFRRKWKPGLTIFFVHKTEKGDALIGYGVVGKVIRRERLSEKEKRECKKHGWTFALDFKYVIKFDEPLLLKDSVLKNLKVRGRYLHGYPLNSERIEALLNQAEQLSL